MPVVVVVSYLVYYNILLQNPTNIIRKYDSYLITKCDKKLLQNAAALLQNAKIITKCDV